MRKFSINLYSIIICITTLGCSDTNYVIYNAVEGKVLSSTDKKPIANVNIYTKKGYANDFGKVNTSVNGCFFIDGLKLPYKYLHHQSNLSFDYIIEKSGFKKKVIRIKNLKEIRNNELDTIDLGIIYLEKIE